MSENASDYPELEPFDLELPTGYRVRLMAAHFWEKKREDDQTDQKPQRYFALRVYCNEENADNRLELAHEFRAGAEFDPTILEKVWGWLSDLVAERQHLEYERLDDFLVALADELAIDSYVDEDAVEHVAHLPEMQVPEMFDYVDDSEFNDQNEPAGPDEPRHSH
jgi:hypothetical protein